MESSTMKMLWKRCIMIFFSIPVFESSHQLYAQTLHQARKPNIIFILADDLGYGNVKSFNAKSPIPTPHIDDLAKQGTSFTRFYAGNTVCAPSRCALMTGKDMGHAYMRGNTRIPLRPQDSTMAQLLQQNGYATGMFGKWGLGEMGTTGSPEIKGFDEFYGYLNQQKAHNYFVKELFEVKKGVIKLMPVDSTQYSHDLIVERAVHFIEENKDKPFFLYLPVTIPHAELAPPLQDMKAFQNADGSSKFPPETPYERGGGTYASQQQPHAAFAAMITKLDSDVGRIVALVKQLGLDDNTYIFFTSDNGPHEEGGADPEYFNSAGPLRGVKRDLYEGGIRVPLIAWSPKNIPAGKINNTPWAFWDVLPTFSELTGSRSLPNINGLSYVPLLKGKKQVKQHDHFYWQFNEKYLQEALIQGDWKLLRFKRKSQAEIFELYNIKSDVGEKKNLIASYPKIAANLKVIMKQSKTLPEHKEFDWSDIEK